MPYLLGLDGGGTKTDAVILDETGAVRGRGRGGPCNLANYDDGILTASILDAVRSACATAALPPDIRFAGACAGVAGYSSKRRREGFARLLFDLVPADLYRVEPDYVVAYWGATEGEPGTIVIAGTGSVAYGRNAAGESLRVGGHGYLLGEDGSGFAIGQAALEQTLERLDRGEAPNRFDRRLFAAIGAEDGDDLTAWVYRDFKPTRVAELAGTIGHWAVEGDPTAGTIVKKQAAGLARRAALLMKRLALPPERAPLYLLGGLWNACAPLSGYFERALIQYVCPDRKRRPAALNIQPPRRDAASGAALLLREEQE